MTNASQSICRVLTFLLIYILCACQFQVSNTDANAGSGVEMQLLRHSGMEEFAVRDLSRQEVGQWLALSTNVETANFEANPEDRPSCVLRPMEYYSFREKKHGRWTPCAPFSTSGNLLFPNVIRSARMEEEMKMFLTSVIAKGNSRGP